MNLQLRRLVAATAATASLIALAGCGDDDEGAGKASSSSSDASDSGAPTPADESNTAVPDDGGDAAEGEAISGEEFAGLLRSALDDATTAHMTMQLGGLGSGEGDADYTQDPPEIAMTMTIDAMGGDVEVRMVDGTIYLKGGSFGSGWVSADLDDPNSPLGSIGGQLDPTQQFESFAAAVTEATYDGEQDVDGESLDHYTATVDTAKLVAELPQAPGDTTGMPATMTQEWWFDDEGLVRKFSSDLGGLAGQVELSFEGWGEDVEIEAPPAGEVTPLGQSSM